MMWDICPILLYQIASNIPHERSGCITDSQIPKYEQFTNYVAVDNNFRNTEDRGLVWIYKH